MPLSIILAFAFVFWRSELTEPWLLLSPDDLVWTTAIALFQPVLIGAAAFASSCRTIRLLARNPARIGDIQHFFGRASIVLRALAVIAFGFLVFLTPWPDWFGFRSVHPALQIAGDMIVMMPFVVTSALIWVAAYGAERALRMTAARALDAATLPVGPEREFRAYLDHQFRNQFLIVAAPMLLILFSANVIRGYRNTLTEWTRLVWASDAALGIVAVAIFLVSPVILRRIWRTHPLENGELRQRLDSHCRRVGLKCRDILVWSSDGLMINAAVMGVLPRFRYVLLSDGLLRAMSVEQIEAVFGHEAGHVRHRHIQIFLVFALVGWLVVSGLMELLAILFVDASSHPQTALIAVEGIGIVGTILVWAVCFGRLSRRFERQADTFGAGCATPPPEKCVQPCSVHLESRTNDSTDGRVCVTGADVFAHALERVAVLNGIPREEHSWRHSSIGDRIRFLRRLAGDPAAAVHFHRSTRRLTRAMIWVAGVGSILSGVYAVFVLDAV